MTIADLREARKMTQLRLAVAADITPTALSRIENGVVTPRLDTAKKIADALGVKVDDLFFASSAL